VYPGHYPRIFVAPKNAQNAETKRQSGAVPILLLVIPALTTSAYSSHDIVVKGAIEVFPGRHAWCDGGLAEEIKCYLSSLKAQVPKVTGEGGR
jgi:hypothetical protein